MIRRLFALVALLFVALPAAAQQPIQVEPGTPFTHLRTGVIFPAEVAGLPLKAMTDFGKQQYDIAATYGDVRENGEELTVYLFRAGLPDVSVWLDRVRGTMAARAGFEPAVPVDAVPRFFARAGSGTPSSARLVYATNSRKIKSTGVVLEPWGEWLFQIRVSSLRRSAGELDALVDQAIPAFTPPAGLKEPRPAYQAARCPDSLSPTPAEAAEVGTGEVTAAILGFMGDPEAAEGTAPPESPVNIWCKDPGSPANYTIFRPNGRGDAYVVALQDAGVVISAGYWDGFLGDVASHNPQIPIPVAVRDSDGDTFYGFFKSVPTVEQALAVVDEGRVFASYDRDSNIHINTDLVKQ